MADSTSLSILRQTPLTSNIATKEWTEENFLSGGHSIWYGECSTASGTAAKTVTIENFPPLSDLKNGDSVRIKFANAQTYNGAPTLNINETGASYIKSNGFTNAARYEWVAGEIIDFSWNVSAWTIVDGGKATTSYYGVTKLASTATTTSDTYAATPGAIFKVVGKTVYGIPNTWTKNTQYNVGDKVYNAGKYYECIQDVSASTFDASYYREIDNAQTQIDNLCAAIEDIDVPQVDGTYLHLSGDTISSNFTLKIAGENVLSGLNGNLAIGNSSKATNNSAALGYNAQATNEYSTALGNNTKANGYYSTAIGLSAQAKNTFASAFGYNANASGQNALAIGSNADASKFNSIAIGYGSKATANNAIQIGNASNFAITNNVADTLQIWDKPLLERTGGKIFIERIPDLPISSVTNLQTTLNNKLSDVKMNGSNVTVTNGVADLSTVLTAHQSLSDLYVLSGEVVEGLSNVVIPKLDTISGLVEDEVEKVDEISAKFDDYSLTGHTHTSSDITNFPPIPTVNNGTLTIQKNGQNVQTFTANQNSSVSANIIVPTKTSDLTNDSGFVVSSDLTKVMEYQGSVTNFSDLPVNAKKGAVYDVISAYNDNPPGTNYAWNGTSWDPLGGSIDTSIFATVSALNKLSNEVTYGLSNVVNPKLSVIADAVEEEVAKLDELSGSLSAYAKLSDIVSIPSDLSAFTNSPGYITQQALSGLSDIYELSSQTINGISNVINPKLSTIADKVEEEVAKLDELSGKLSGYALTSDIPLSVSQLINDKGYITSSYVSLSAVEQNYVIVLTEEQKTALIQQSGIPAETWGDFVVHIDAGGQYGYIGNIDCYSVSQNANGDYVYTGGMPVIESVLGWVPNITIIQGTTTHNVLSVGNTSADLALKSDIDGFLPLDGGGSVTGNIAIEDIDGNNLFFIGPYGKVEIGTRTRANNSGAIAIGYATSSDYWNSLAIGYESYASGHGAIAIGKDANVSAQYSIQLGIPAHSGAARTVLSTDNTFRVWEYPMLDGNTGNIPYARLSAALDPVLGNILSALQEINGTVGN